MTNKQYWLLCFLAGVCVLLAIEKYRVSHSLSLRQQHIIDLQNRINGNLVDRLGPDNVKAVLNDVVNLSLSNATMRSLLTEAGWQFTPNPATNSPAQGAVTNSTTSTTNPPSH